MILKAFRPLLWLPPTIGLLLIAGLCACTLGCGSKDEEALREIDRVLGPNAQENIPSERGSGAPSRTEQVQVDAPTTGEEPSREPSIPLVVLDPGHGGRDQGACAEEVCEARLVLEVALKVRDYLRSQARPDARPISVAMTRESDVFVSLDQRREMATAQNASLFVSIHANSTPESIGRGGMSAFLFHPHADAEGRAALGREDGGASSSDRSLEGWLAQRGVEQNLEVSRVLAHAVLDSVSVVLAPLRPRFRTRGVHQAPFRVLRNTTMTSCLLEIGFLSSREELTALRDPRYREALALGIASGIQTFVRR